MIDRQVVDDMLEKAFGLIQQGDAEAAIVVGKQLLDVRNARGFEIIALAYEQQGRSDEAIAVLKDGVAKVPGAWPLWELLGNIYSDLGELPSAHDAYQKAQSCPKADMSSINYNFAILLKREGKFNEAMSMCDSITSEDLRNKVRVLRLSLMNALGKHDDAINFGNSIIAEIMGQTDLPDEDMQDLARAYAELGRAWWEGKYDRQTAWENAWKALEWNRSDTSALWLVREIIGRKSPQSAMFKLVVEGQWHFALEADKPPPGFITTYEIVAESPEDALTFAQDLEPVDVRPTMKIDSHEELEKCPENNQGVYWRSAYGFYSQQG